MPPTIDARHLLTSEERSKMLSRIHSLVYWVGMLIPEHEVLGGTEIGANALLRFYVLHIVLLPAAGIIFMAVHFWRIRKDGGISRPL